MKKTIKEIEATAKKFFQNSPGSHDWYHTKRVRNLALQIASYEKADSTIVEIAAILHDIGRKEQEISNGKLCHAEHGAKIAEKILKKYPLKEEEKQNILHCIKTHRFRGKEKPKTKEAKIVSDADNLDAIGAIGIGRAFVFSGEIGATVHIPNQNHLNSKEHSKEDTAYREYLVKLSKIKDRMYTKEGKRIAQKRHNFMKKFFYQLNEESMGRR